jgi:hypothetical protein
LHSGELSLVQEFLEARGVTALAEWTAEMEARYAAGLVPRLPSDTTIDESSELSEVSVLGPADAHGDMDSMTAGDSPNKNAFCCTSFTCEHTPTIKDTWYN